MHLVLCYLRVSFKLKHVLEEFSKRSPCRSYQVKAFVGTRLHKSKMLTTPPQGHPLAGQLENHCSEGQGLKTAVSRAPPHLPPPFPLLSLSLFFSSCPMLFISFGLSRLLLFSYILCQSLLFDHVPVGVKIREIKSHIVR